MSLPNVKITLGNGNLGRGVAASEDGIAGMILTGTSVSSTLVLNKCYKLLGTNDLRKFGVTATNNALVDKEVRAFYAEAGEGSELYIVVVSTATKLSAMVAVEEASPLRVLLNGSGRRVRLVAINHIPGSDYMPVMTKCIDGEAISAVTAMQTVAEEYTGHMSPFRGFVPAPWNGKTESIHKPSEGNANRVGMILASDGNISNKPSAAMGKVLGRAARIKVHQSLGRVKDGVLLSEGYFTNGKTADEEFNNWELLHDAGYIFFRTYPGRSGCYLNGDSMSAPLTDDYSNLHLGRVIDKVMRIVYDTYVNEIMDNVYVDDAGKMESGVVKNFEGMVESAVNAGMSGEISKFEAYIDPNQNVLSTGVLNVKCKLLPQGTLSEINVDLSFNTISD